MVPTCVKFVVDCTGMLWQHGLAAQAKIQVSFAQIYMRCCQNSSVTQFLYVDRGDGHGLCVLRACYRLCHLELLLDKSICSTPLLFREFCDFADTKLGDTKN